MSASQTMTNPDSSNVVGSYSPGKKAKGPLLYVPQNIKNVNAASFATLQERPSKASLQNPSTLNNFTTTIDDPRHPQKRQPTQQQTKPPKDPATNVIQTQRKIKIKPNPANSQNAQ